MSQSISKLRWLGAAALLLALFTILIIKAPQRNNEELPATEAAYETPPSAEQRPGASLEAVPLDAEEQLPELESLSEWNPDEAPARRNLDLQHWTTSQGARVYFMQAEELPMLDVQLLFAAGASRDGETLGVASMTNAMLNEGAGARDAGDIAAGFERLGAEFSNSSHRDMALASLRSLTQPDKLDPALALFTEVVSQPSFPEDAFERLRNQLLASLRFRLQRAASLGSEAFWETLYPEHPYGRLPQGLPESVQQLTPADLRAFHGRFYTSGNAIIAMVGAIDRSQAERIAQRLADALPQGPAAEPIATPEAIEGGRRHIEFPGQQTHILVGQHGISRHHPDYAALYVGNQILGGSGFGSRLMEEIRERRGFSYSVSSSFIPMEATGPFMISMQTRADQVDAALEVIDSTLDRFIAEGPTESELVRIKRQILGQFPLSTASNSAIVGQLGAIGFYGLPLNHLQLFMDQVQAVTREEVRDAFARNLAADQRVIVTVGPEIETVAEAPELLVDPVEEPVTDMIEETER
jgi:zinc protease